jgi:hypothetical protein
MERSTMIKRALANRLERLEDRFGTNTEQKEYVIRFVAPGGMVESTLTLRHGKRVWWYPPGYEPGTANNGTAWKAPQPAQMAEDVLR